MRNSKTERQTQHKRVIKPVVESHMQIAVFAVGDVDGLAVQLGPSLGHQRFQAVMIFFMEQGYGFAKKTELNVVAQAAEIFKQGRVNRQGIQQAKADCGEKFIFGKMDADSGLDFNKAQTTGNFKLLAQFASADAQRIAQLV